MPTAGFEDDGLEELPQRHLDPDKREKPLAIQLAVLQPGVHCDCSVRHILRHAVEGTDENLAQHRRMHGSNQVFLYEADDEVDSSPGEYLTLQCLHTLDYLTDL